MSWTRFFPRRDWDRERSREIDAYLQIETDENISRGMSPGDARYAALKKLGNSTQIREEINPTAARAVARLSANGGTGFSRC